MYMKVKSGSASGELNRKQKNKSNTKSVSFMVCETEMALPNKNDLWVIFLQYNKL